MCKEVSVSKEPLVRKPATEKVELDQSLCDKCKNQILQLDHTHKRCRFGYSKHYHFCKYLLPKSNKKDRRIRELEKTYNEALKNWTMLENWKEQLREVWKKRPLKPMVVIEGSTYEWYSQGTIEDFYRKFESLLFMKIAEEVKSNV